MITIHTPLGPRVISAAVAEALGIRPGEHVGRRLWELAWKDEMATTRAAPSR